MPKLSNLSHPQSSWRVRLGPDVYFNARTARLVLSEGENISVDVAALFQSQEARKSFESLLTNWARDGIRFQSFMVMQTIPFVQMLMQSRSLYLECFPDANLRLWIRTPYFGLNKKKITPMSWNLSQNEKKHFLRLPGGSCELELPSRYLTSGDLKFYSKWLSGFTCPYRGLERHDEIFINSSIEKISRAGYGRKRPTELSFLGEIKLPSPRPIRTQSLRELDLRRRSSRNFKRQKLSLSSVADLLESVARRKKNAGRSAPSAGGLNNLNIILVVDRVEGLERGIYFYSGHKHCLKQLIGSDLSSTIIAQIMLALRYDQTPNVAMLFVADYENHHGSYRDLSHHLTLLNTGVMIDRCYLYAEALNISGCAAGTGAGNWELKSAKILPPTWFISGGFCI